MILNRRRISNSKLDDFQNLISFIESQNINFSLYSDIVDKSNIDKLIKKEEVISREKQTYDLILIEDNVKFNSKNISCILWVSNLENSIKITYCSSFDNNSIKLLQKLDYNGFCQFNIFYQYPNEKEKQKLIELGHFLDKSKINWHFIKKNELYELNFIDNNGQLKWNKTDPDKHLGHLYNICVIDNESLKTMNFEFVNDNESKITLLYINAHNGDVFIKATSGIFGGEKWNNFTLEIDKYINEQIN